MSPSSTPLTRQAVVDRLRESGCVFAEDEAALLLSCATTAAHLGDMVHLRSAGSPLEHVLGWADFHGVRVAVGPGVFVPRRRTEFLVWHTVIAARVVAARATPGHRPVVVDLCCGSGAIGAALSVDVEELELHAVDIDPTAVHFARHNLRASRARVYAGDLFGPLPDRLRGQVDVIVANAPYVPTAAMALLPREARNHEPRVALDGGEDGLDVQRHLVREAPRWLAAGGRLLIETSERQAPTTAGILAAAGLAPTIVSSRRWGACLVTGRPAPHRAGADDVVPGRSGAKACSGIRTTAGHST